MAPCNAKVLMAQPLKLSFAHFGDPSAVYCMNNLLGSSELKLHPRILHSSVLQCLPVATVINCLCTLDKMIHCVSSTEALCLL